ncbi:hypothetical protein TWF481_010546 [Arthrobotrys musiformis]|uniref:CCR4-NOT transcription complex subunit 11 n=1 Tax=Arthrobotrys musiformis TaxID=47236 RepID=A0AAV9W175_9PEZI
MASFAQLPDELRRLLESVATPFSSTATKFLEAIPNPEHHFARACEILITLTTVNGPGGIAGGSSNGTTGGSSGGNDWRPMEKNIGFRLNATFMLYWLYKEHDIHVNPFRSHFLETCEAEKGRYVNTGEKESAVERLRRARCKMLLAILGGEGSKLSDLSAKDFYTNFEHLRLGESADLRTFSDEDEFPPISAWARPEPHQQTHHHSRTGGTNGYPRQRTTGTPSPAPVRGQPVFAQNYPANFSSSSSSSPSLSSSANRNPPAAEETPTVPNAILAPPSTAEEEEDILKTAIENVHLRHLTPTERNIIRSNPSPAVNLYTIQDAETYQKTLDLNPETLYILTVELLTPSSAKRDILLTTILPRLNLELRSLDLINHLVYRPAINTPPLQNEYATATPLLTQEERTRLLHVFTSNCIRQLEHPYGDEIPVRSKGPDVGRKVKLLCMFLTGLLTREIVSVGEMYYELQDLYMGFTGFREARELWTNVTGGRGVGGLNGG